MRVIVYTDLISLEKGMSRLKGKKSFIDTDLLLMAYHFE